MKYTLWLNGHLLGETRLEHRNPQTGQRLGALHPTAYGSELVPNLCGFLPAAVAMRKALEKLGVDPDKDADRALELMENTPEGERFSEMVRALGALELRSAGGERAAFHTVILTDLRELADVSRTLDIEPAEIPEGMPRYIISATPMDVRAVSLTLRKGSGMRIQVDPN